MKITKISAFELVGGERDGLSVFEADHPYLNFKVGDPYRQLFTEIETDENISGYCIGGSADIYQLGSLLIGEDPRKNEFLWERMYYSQYVRTRSTNTIAILDLALWDLKGKIANEPVFSLLGGPFREEIPVYAAMLGFSTKPERVAEASAEWVSKGFRALKWYIPYNETHGEEGFRKNIEIIEAARKVVGEEIGLIVDFGISNPNQNSWLYISALAKEYEKLNVKWLEEPLNFDDLEAHARLRDKTSIPIALGERWYNRWQFRDIIQSGAATIIQPDPYFAMGITEIRKIIAFASVHGIPVIPHSNESFRYCAHLLFATPERVVPMAEYGIRTNHSFQYFFKEYYEPVNGFIRQPETAGLSSEIDWDKVKERNYLG